MYHSFHFLSGGAGIKAQTWVWTVKTCPYQYCGSRVCLFFEVGWFRIDLIPIGIETKPTPLGWGHKKGIRNAVYFSGSF